MTDQPLETVGGGRYVISRVLGVGAQGETLDAVDKREGRPVAIKRFLIRGARSWKDVELAEREARVLASLSHPALPRYVDHFEAGGALYLVMDKMEGESVASVLRRGGSFSSADVLRFLTEAADVLAYLHGRAPSVIHRDLKPGNVIYRPDGSFAFVDFGSVRDSLKPEGGSTVVGTFGYMAPEQFQGRALPASDVYAIGATALAMLTRREPEALPHKGLAIDVKAALGGQASPELVDVLSTMLEPDPDRRASSIAGLLPRLRAPASRASAEPGAGWPPGPPWQAHPWQSSQRSSEPFDGDPPWASHWEGRVERIARQVGRQAERAARRAERHRRRFGRRPPYGPRPVPPLVFAHFGLTIAELVVTLLLRVAIPVVLTLLSLVFGPNLRRAASRASALGARAAEAIARARQGLSEPTSSEDWRAPEPPREADRRRVGTPASPPARVRVSDEPLASDGGESPESVTENRARRRSDS